MKEAISKFASCLETHKSANKVPSLTLQTVDHPDSQIIAVVHEVRREHRNAANFKTTKLVSVYQKLLRGESLMCNIMNSATSKCALITIMSVFTKQVSVIKSLNATYGVT